MARQKWLRQFWHLLDLLLYNYCWIADVYPCQNGPCYASILIERLPSSGHFENLDCYHKCNEELKWWNTLSLSIQSGRMFHFSLFWIFQLWEMRVHNNCWANCILHSCTIYIHTYLYKIYVQDIFLKFIYVYHKLQYCKYLYIVTTIFVLICSNLMHFLYFGKDFLILFLENWKQLHMVSNDKKRNLS